MSAFSELLKANFPEGWSNREVARRAEDLNIKLSRATVDKYTSDSHGVPKEPTVRAFHHVLGIPLQDLRLAARVRVGEAGSWKPPAEADRLTDRQRRALTDLIRAIVAPDSSHNAEFGSVEGLQSAVTAAIEGEIEKRDHG